MLIRHSALYLMARGLPGVVNFLALAVYTRLLTTEDYGRYALVVSGVGFLNVVLFQWLRLSLLRFLPAYLESPSPLLGTLLAAFWGIVLLSGVVGLGLALLWPDPTWRGLILLAVPLLWAQAWFELNLELVRSKLQPWRYGLASGLKSVSAVVVGAALAVWGLRAFGPLIGLLIGFLIAGLGLARQEWRGIRPEADSRVLAEVLRYGLPLTATFALSFVVLSSDRFLIAHFLGEASTGAYAAGYDLAWNSIILLMMTVNLASYPITMRALEAEGKEAARAQLIRNSELQFLVALPATVGLAMLAPQIGAVMFGPTFRSEATALLPWVATSALLHGIRAYHFDLAFQMSRRTIGQVWVLGAAALSNVIFNLMWLPRFGVLGAAWATLAAYGLALLLSVVLGKRVFEIPLSWRGLSEAGIASLLMAGTLNVLPEVQGVWGLLFSVTAGATVYGLAIALLKMRRLRAVLLGWELWAIRNKRR